MLSVILKASAASSVVLLILGLYKCTKEILSSALIIFEQSLLVIGLVIGKADVRELVLGRISRTLVAIKLYLTLLFDKVVLTTCFKATI